jgi:hypothetical protein
MTWDEIYRQYARQWILKVLDEQLNVVEGGCPHAPEIHKYLR